jgi:hypothetical protein
VATPEEEEQVRRLLASAGPVPMPDHVRDRLQRVVADLAAERSAADSPTAQTAARAAAEPTAGPPAEYVESGRLPRRRWPQLLVAAAALAVLGTTVGVVSQLGGSSGNNATSAGSASTAQSSRAGGSHGQQRTETQGLVPARHTLSAQEARAQSMLHSDTLRADVRRVEHFAPQLRAARPIRVPRGCVTPATRPGDQLFPVRLDGRKATLLLQPPQNGTRVARVYPCDNARTPYARTFVPSH